MEFLVKESTMPKMYLPCFQLLYTSREHARTVLLWQVLCQTCTLSAYGQKLQCNRLHLSIRSIPMYCKSTIFGRYKIWRFGQGGPIWRTLIWHSEVF